MYSEELAWVPYDTQLPKKEGWFKRWVKQINILKKK